MSGVDVIIVGAGLSGLSAARALSQRGLKVVVLEATERVGGRTHTLSPGEGDPQFGWADVGASYVGPTQYHILRMCEELGVKRFLCSDELNSFEYRHGKRYQYVGIVPHMGWRNPVANWDLALMVRRVEKMCWEIPADKPWEAPHAKEWDQMTVKEFYDKHCWTKACNEYLSSTSNMDTCSDERDMSILFYLWYMRQAGGPRRLWGVTGGAEEGKLVGGSQQLAEKLAQQLEKAVILNQPVVMIRYGPSDVTVQTLGGTEYNAKYLILATPPITQLKIRFEPPLPAMRSCLIQHSPMGLVMKCIAFYKKPFWEEKGFNGYVTCTDGFEVVGLVTEDQKPGGKLCGLICFIYLQQMLKLSEMSDGQKQGEVCKTLSKFFGTDEALNPVHFITKTWSTEQYIGGGYTAHYPPGALTMFGPAMRAPIGSRVFLAGTETATHWAGYMSGAIDAGQRAAREVLCASGLIEEREVWLQEPTVRYEPNWVEHLLPSIESVVRASLALPLLGAAIVVYKRSSCHGPSLFAVMCASVRLPFYCIHKLSTLFR